MRILVAVPLLELISLFFCRDVKAVDDCNYRKIFFLLRPKLQLRLCEALLVFSVGFDLSFKHDDDVGK